MGKQRQTPGIWKKSEIEFRSVSDALDSDLPSMAKQLEKKSKDQVLARIEMMLAELNEYFNVGKPMTKYQIQTTAKDIYSECYYMKFEEIELIFRDGRKGLYGELYRLDGQVIIGWCRKYQETRFEHVQQLRMNERSKTTSGADVNIVNLSKRHNKKPFKDFDENTGQSKFEKK